MEENNKLSPLDFVWGKWEDWSKMSGSKYGDSWFDLEAHVIESDIEEYLEIIYRDISRNFNVSYKELKTLIENENLAFFSRKKKIFKINSCYGKDSRRLMQLERMLMVPIKRKYNPTNNLENCLEIFGKLSDEEKINFLKKIGKINIEVSFLHPEDVEKK